MNRALLASGDMTWQTPECVLERVRKLGPIALDPCTNADNPVGAERFYTPRDFGLSKPWAEDAAGGLVYVNSPYGRELPEWVVKCVAEAALGAEMVALVPSRTDTRWFNAALDSCQALAFWRGRVKFRGAKDCAPFPSALFYWGARQWEFAVAFRDVCRVSVGGIWTKGSAP
jgi:site-specific DNA-methyltransferase (adenine-specific)